MNKRADETIDKGVLLLSLLSRTERVTDGHINELLQPINLTCAQHQVLLLLINAGEPLPLGQIAERLHSVRSNATQMVDRLVAEGLVERIYDPVDRRRVLAQVTEEGRRRFEAATQLEQRVLQELYHHFSKQELEQFIAFLSRLEDAWQ